MQASHLLQQRPEANKLRAELRASYFRDALSQLGNSGEKSDELGCLQLLNFLSRNLLYVFRIIFFLLGLVTQVILFFLLLSEVNSVIIGFFAFVQHIMDSDPGR
jgi:hypothetical protein